MAGEQAAGAPEQSWTPPPELDGFRVIRQLGRGGMGQVYLGHDDALDRPVALKFLSAADPKFSARDRFLVEARAIARLQHPNVVGIYRVGEVQGRPYIAYELIDGKSLDQLPKPVPWQRALELGIGVARGLSAAHRREVLHRDVKPANVMVADSGEIKLLDFGLAKLLDSSSAPPKSAPSPAGVEVRAQLVNAPLTAEGGVMATMVSARAAGSVDPEQATVAAGGPAANAFPDGASLTATGALLGTPLYMAPELWRGEPATAETDVYALGLVLYELLSGRLPHEGRRPSEIAEAVLTHAPPPIRSIVPGVPVALADVVDCCLRPRREERFPSAEEVRDTLEAIRAVYEPFSPQDATLARADEIRAVTASFARLAPRSDELAARMYELLFARHPDIRSLFPADMTEQRKKLVGALVVVVDNLRRPERLLPLLEDLGRRHAGYGVKPEHFGAVGRAQIDAIVELDAELDDFGRVAWEHAYEQIAVAMQRGLDDEAPTPLPGSLMLSSHAPHADHEPPRTRYARSGEVNVAYQITGGGPVDVVLVSGWLSHLEALWEWPPAARFLRALTSLGRLIVFDARGTGLSDPVAPGQPVLLEEQMADLRAVMDAAGAERAALIAFGTGVAPAVLFAATHPERTRALVLYGGGAKLTAGDGHPHGLDPAAYNARFDQMRASWGGAVLAELFAPTLAQDDAFRRFWARYLRTAAGPGAAVALLKSAAATDVRPALPAIHVPALVLHRTGDKLVTVEQGRYVAQRIPGAKLVELPGDDHLPWAGDGARIIEEVRGFLEHATPPLDSSDMLAAVVSLVPPQDDADSISRPSPVIARALAAAAQGRADPLTLLCEREIARFRGIELDGIGHATAMFDGPARAVRFARAMITRARAIGVELAAGVCFDACSLGDADVRGPAVRVAPIVAGRAGLEEILVTDAVRALLAGAGVRFLDRGAIEGAGRIYAVLADTV